MIFRFFSIIPLLVLLSGPSAIGQETKKVKTGVSGEAIFKGEKIPPSLRVRTDSDSEFCGNSLSSEQVLINDKTKGIKNAVIVLNPTDPAFKFPEASKSQVNVLLSFKCRFAPHVIAIQKGSPLYIKNGDPILHSFHFYQKTKSLFNLALPPGSKIIEKEFLREGVIHVKCDIHEFMEGYILVTASPLSEVTKEDGLFDFDDIAPGEYTISVWHELFGKMEKTLTLKSGEYPSISLFIKP